MTLLEDIWYSQSIIIHPVNLDSSSKDISSVTEKSARHADKVFPVNDFKGGDPLLITLTPTEKFVIGVGDLAKRLGLE